MYFAHAAKLLIKKTFLVFTPIFQIEHWSYDKLIHFANALSEKLFPFKCQYQLE